MDVVRMISKYKKEVTYDMNDARLTYPGAEFESIEKLRPGPVLNIKSST